jgi:hypothetical protein
MFIRVQEDLMRIYASAGRDALTREEVTVFNVQRVSSEAEPPLFETPKWKTVESFSLDKKTAGQLAERLLEWSKS